jgi:hypothetical protein
MRLPAEIRADCCSCQHLRAAVCQAVRRNQRQRLQPQHAVVIYGAKRDCPHVQRMRGSGTHLWPKLQHEEANSKLPAALTPCCTAQASLSCVSRDAGIMQLLAIVNRVPIWYQVLIGQNSSGFKNLVLDSVCDA